MVLNIVLNVVLNVVFNIVLNVVLNVVRNRHTSELLKIEEARRKCKKLDNPSNDVSVIK